MVNWFKEKDVRLNTELFKKKNVCVKLSLRKEILLLVVHNFEMSHTHSRVHIFRVYFSKNGLSFL